MKRGWKVLLTGIDTDDFTVREIVDFIKKLLVFGIVCPLTYGILYMLHLMTE